MSNKTKVRHLTHTGRYAGAPYCGAPRGDDAGIHLLCAYQRGVDNPQAYIDKHITCMACRKAYAEAGPKTYIGTPREDDIYYDSRTTPADRRLLARTPREDR
jgi:hypothetical protein